MRALRFVLYGLVALWALASLYVFVWIRERYGRGGPMPARQAAILHHPLRRWIHPLPQTLEKFRIKPGDTVLELGPGPGYFSVEAARIVGPGGRIACVDLQPGMLQMLAGHLEEASVTNAYPLVGDATRLPLADASVDAAFLVTVLGEIPDRLQALAELRRVLKPGGVLSFSESLADPDYVFQASLRDLCRAMGFRELSCSGERLGYTMTFTAA
ncbi:MAG: methyltransferase domain-containing protein [Dehalococcoidia bacterium]|nr:methyltransferase domain-containing protein [Dehalococcoidia bacterium]